MKHFKVKTWRMLDPSNIAKEDLLWLQSNTCRIEYDSGIETIPGSNNLGMLSQMQIRAPSLKFITNNEKQETLLKIKYADRLILESWVNCTSAYNYV